jgi:hypothetical protein
MLQPALRRRVRLVGGVLQLGLCSNGLGSGGLRMLRRSPQQPVVTVLLSSVLGCLLSKPLLLVCSTASEQL